MLKFLQQEIFFLCLLFPVIFTAKPCTNIPPFLNRLRDGVDITKLDLLPLSLASNDGFRNPVFDYTCDFNITRNLDGIVYRIPDQVWSIVNIPSGLLDTRVEIHKNSHSFKRSLAAKVDIFGISKGLFSASFTYKKVKSYFSSASKYVEDLTSHTAGYKVNMMPEWGLEFGRFAKMYIEKFLPQNLNDTTITKYMRFIETFGTHYFKQGRFGGILRLFLATDKSYFRKGSEKKVEMEAKSTFKNFLTIGGKFSMSTEKLIPSLQRLQESLSGQTNLLAEEGISTWQPTVLQNPWLYGGGLVEISRMIEDDIKRQSMKRAVQIENEAKELLQKPLPIHNEVITLSRMISPSPDWVKKFSYAFNGPTLTMHHKNVMKIGIQNTDVCTNRGANIDKLIDVLQKKDMSTYRTIIIHIGGNDLDNGDNLQSIRDNYEALLYLLNIKCHPHCTFVVSGILPRKGLNMHNPNEMLKDLCEQFNIQFIDHTNMFYDKNYNLSYSFFHHDGIHLSKKGHQRS
ncbi:unnamed protein product [Mytilus edulis]|uniref:MACPF domain-containing protein n=1 Tax=Mytilus edulis TaxID=6550 RepID=A0A8S3TXC4_MYTED|nr:unnamed protein product [Mytilus edulis]